MEGTDGNKGEYSEEMWRRRLKMLPPTLTVFHRLILVDENLKKAYVILDSLKSESPHEFGKYKATVRESTIPWLPGYDAKPRPRNSGEYILEIVSGDSVKIATLPYNTFKLIPDLDFEGGTYQTSLRAKYYKVKTISDQHILADKEVIFCVVGKVNDELYHVYIVKSDEKLLPMGTICDLTIRKDEERLSLSYRISPVLAANAPQIDSVSSVSITEPTWDGIEGRFGMYGTTKDLIRNARAKGWGNKRVQMPRRLGTQGGAKKKRRRKYKTRRNSKRSKTKRHRKRSKIKRSKTKRINKRRRR
jgi:hypothetical protein